MKALSLTQPWASLIAIGIKQLKLVVAHAVSWRGLHPCCQGIP